MLRTAALRAPIALLCLLALALVGLAAAPTSAHAATPPAKPAAKPAVPATLPAAIEPQQIDYVAQDSCQPGFKAGAKKLIALLAKTYPIVHSQGSYACGTDGDPSEHYEGRAIDWMASVKNKAQHADALAMISWLLATDSHGNKFAMARRLGVMYIIYDNRIWGGWDDAWEPYNNCAKTPQAADDNACHRTHVHLSLTWNGAMGRTTFWAGKVTATDFGPCRAKDLNWAGATTTYNPRPCPDYPAVKAPAKASSTLKSLETYSGAYVATGSSGPAVAAVQRAVHVSATGTFAAQTRAAVAAFQAKHHLVATGSANATTWRALLAANQPASK
jgi:hypothetical protein